MGNVALFTAGLKDSDACKYCGFLETFWHMFWECDIVETFWMQLWIKVIEDVSDLDPQRLLFGNFLEFKECLLLLSVLTKKEIICARWSNSPPSVEGVWRKFLYFAKVEELIFTDNHRKEKFIKCWFPFLCLL